MRQELLISHYSAPPGASHFPTSPITPLFPHNSSVLSLVDAVDNSVARKARKIEHLVGGVVMLVTLCVLTVMLTFT